MARVVVKPTHKRRRRYLVSLRPFPSRMIRAENERQDRDQKKGWNGDYSKGGSPGGVWRETAGDEPLIDYNNHKSNSSGEIEEKVDNYELP